MENRNSFAKLYPLQPKEGVSIYVSTVINQSKCILPQMQHLCDNGNMAVDSM